LHGARRQSDELRLGLDVVLLVEVHLHAAVLIGDASVAQVVAGVVVLRAAGLCMVWYGTEWCPSYPLDRNRCDQVVAAGSGAG
jgi:hypothetical protein